MNPGTLVRSFTAQGHRASGRWSEWHYHREWELVFVQSGSGVRCIGSSVEKFSTGDLVIIPGDLPHAWHWHGGKPLRCTVLHFLPQAWGDAFWEIPEVQAFRMLCGRAAGGARFAGREVEKIGRGMEELSATDSATLASLSKLLGIFSQMTTLECFPLNAVETRTGGRQNRLLDDLLAWVAANLKEDITQQEAADRVRMNPSSFCRWFKAQTGCSFKHYLNEIRVAKVCAAIARGGQSITESAFEAGYNNLSNFNRRFLKVTGVTPSAFRKQVRMSLR
ncbi:AraC family transcriptional regulator [Luteolibacter sp. LG18]|nr:AraC family transcriptional regulator [Luteolibacter sp. LG18]